MMNYELGKRGMTQGQVSHALVILGEKGHECWRSWRSQLHPQN